MLQQPLIIKFKLAEMFSLLLQFECMCGDLKGGWIKVNPHLGLLPFCEHAFHRVEPI